MEMREGDWRKTYKSAAVILLRSRNGFWVATTSSRPTFAWNAVSISEKMAIEPSAPPPLIKTIIRAMTSAVIINGVPKLSLRLESGRERDGVVEGETERLVRLVGARIEEQIVLEIVANGEQGAASRVGGGVDTVWACNTPGEGT